MAAVDAPSATVPIVALVVIFGCEIVIPEGAKARAPPSASIVGRDITDVSMTLDTNCVGLKAGLVVNESFAASIFRAFASAARM